MGKLKKKLNSGFLKISEGFIFLDFGYHSKFESLYKPTKPLKMPSNINQSISKDMKNIAGDMMASYEKLS
ncbi:MAG: hypothetical protein JNL11_17440 [Bdellovibrionaceae bacterium]|nr:hypothetical protein [Pseudobdellovibrionaceae bacterium]